MNVWWKTVRCVRNHEKPIMSCVAPKWPNHCRVLVAQDEFHQYQGQRVASTCPPATDLQLWSNSNWPSSTICITTSRILQIGMNIDINIFQTIIKICTLFDNSMVQFYGRESYANSSGKEYGKYGYNLESNLKWNPGKKSGRKKKSYHQICPNQGYEHSESSRYLTNMFCLIKFSQIGWAGYPNLVGKCQMPTNLDLDFTFNSFWDLLDVKASYFCILVPFPKLFVHLNN